MPKRDHTGSASNRWSNRRSSPSSAAAAGSVTDPSVSQSARHGVGSTHIVSSLSIGRDTVISPTLKIWPWWSRRHSQTDHSVLRTKKDFDEGTGLSVQQGPLDPPRPPPVLLLPLHARESSRHATRTESQELRNARRCNAVPRVRRSFVAKWVVLRSTTANAESGASRGVDTTSRATAASFRSNASVFQLASLYSSGQPHTSIQLGDDSRLISLNSIQSHGHQSVQPDAVHPDVGCADQFCLSTCTTPSSEVQSFLNHRPALCIEVPVPATSLSVRFVGLCNNLKDRLILDRFRVPDRPTPSCEFEEIRTAAVRKGRRIHSKV